MKVEERYEALLLIKKELEEHLAFYPEHRARLHGGLQHANEAYQLCKKLLAYEGNNIMDDLVKESQESGLYNDNPCASISLHNIE